MLSKRSEMDREEQFTNLKQQKNVNGCQFCKERKQLCQ